MDINKPTYNTPSANKEDGDALLVKKVNEKIDLTERIVGFTDFDWRFCISNLSGECTMPADFTPFDKAICRILLAKGSASLNEIGEILRLTTDDAAEKSLLEKAIDRLIDNKMVERDEECYENVYKLSEIGKTFAQREHYNIETFTRDFELYFDLTGDLGKDAKDELHRLRHEEQRTCLFSELNLKDIDEVRAWAETQAPEVHHPAKDFILKSYERKGTKEYSANVTVVLVENFKEQTLRALVYDKGTNAVIDRLSEAFDRLEDRKAEILKKIADQASNDSISIERTTEQKSKAQEETEFNLSLEQEKIDLAKGKKNEKLASSLRKKAMDEKRHFNTVEFEEELKRIFTSTEPGELWIFSPWIKRYATLRRLNDLKNYLRKGGEIYIAYSLPENNAALMADKEMLDELNKLQEKHKSLHVCQLEPFHYKRVWLRTPKQKFYYTGSFNILSFYVKGDAQSFRQEEMTKLDWSNEHDKEYNEIRSKFDVEKQSENAKGGRK